MEAILRNNCSYRILRCALLLVLVLFSSCSKPVYQDRLPDALHHLMAGPLSGELILDKACNPFYIRMDPDCSRSGLYLVAARDGRNMQRLLLCCGDEIAVLKTAELGFAAHEKIRYIKETGRFPAGAGIPHTGGGAIIVSSQGNVRWIYYSQQWRIINPDDLPGN